MLKVPEKLLGSGFSLSGENAEEKISIFQAIVIVIVLTGHGSLAGGPVVWLIYGGHVDMPCCNYMDYTHLVLLSSIADWH